MELALETALNEFATHRHPFGVLSIDLDRFKRVNDSYGHAVGDLILRETAQTLRNALRITDTVGRWGGDEFIAIIRNPDAGLLGSLADLPGHDRREEPSWTGELFRDELWRH